MNACIISNHCTQPVLVHNLFIKYNTLTLYYFLILFVPKSVSNFIIAISNERALIDLASDLVQPIEST